MSMGQAKWSKWSKVSVWAGICAVLSCPNGLAETPNQPRKLVTIEGITEFDLDNGLRVLLFPDSSTPNVTVNLTVLTGSRQEGYGETGMAHLLEHMLFKGTPQHRDIPKALKQHGADYNGTTTVDRTNYFETMAGTDENLEFALALEADRLVNSFVRREDLLSEMTVVRNEFESGENNPEYVLGQRMMAAAYDWHNYGKPTIGNRSDIERVPIERLQAFYRKHYQPDNCVLIVAGKFDEAKALAWISQYFGPLKKANRIQNETYTAEPAQDGERAVALRRVGKVAYVGLLYHIPAGAHPDFPAFQVLANILGTEPAGRLYRQLVQTKLATRVYANAASWHDPGVLEVMAEVGHDKSPEAVRGTLIDVVEGFISYPAATEEVERAKREILSQREILMTRSNSVGRILSEWAALGDWRLFFLDRDVVANVTVGDVNRVAAKYLVGHNRTVGIYYPSEVPQRAAIPETPAISELVRHYTGSQQLMAGEVFDPTPENVERRVQRSQLAAGMKLALLPKKTRGQTATIHLALHYGNEGSLRGHTSATQFLAALMQRGTRMHTRQQIRDRLNELRTRIRGSGVLGDLIFTLEAKRPQLKEAVQLLCEILREPSFPADEFDVLRRETRADLEKELTEPMPLALREIQRRLSPYPSEDVRYVPTIQESVARLDAVTLEEIRKIYQEQMGAQSAELAAVGDFDPVELRGQIERDLGDWKAAIPYRRIERPAQTEVSGSRHIILTPDKANALFIAGHTLALNDTDPDYAALELADFLFGGGALSSRLGNRIRQKEGLSYGVQSHFSASALDKSARFLLLAICNPANMDKVDRAIGEELDKLLQNGIGEAELAEAKKGLLEQKRVQRAHDAVLTSMLATALFYGRTLAYTIELEKRIESLTPEQVMAAVRRHWAPRKLVIIEAGDLKKQADRR
jgi:zinc protease